MLGGGGIFCIQKICLGRFFRRIVADSCDHSAFGDAKLLTAIAAVESADKLPEAWGKIKVDY